MEKIRELVLFYVKNLYLVDYMLILLVFFLFTCILLLCVFLRHRPFTALLIMALDIVACFMVFIYGYRFIDYEARKRESVVNSQRIIGSSGALVLDFDISNLSKHYFTNCKVTAKLYAQTDTNASFVDKYKNRFIPFRQKSVMVKDLEQNSSKTQRITFENFNFEGNYSVRLKSECF